MLVQVIDYSYNPGRILVLLQKVLSVDSQESRYFNESSTLFSSCWAALLRCLSGNV